MKRSKEELELEFMLEGLYQKSCYISGILDGAEIAVRREMLPSEKKIMAADALRRVDHELEDLHKEVRKLREEN